MPRIGMNPSRGRTTEYKPAGITLAVLTYLPEESGYFEHRFDVTRLCLESLIQNTPEPYDLIVFDNGSSSRLVEYLVGLRDEGYIHYLMLSSRNIGKIGALQMLFHAARGEVVAYCDDDVFFLPGWLDAHLKILETYPKVGLATGFYIRSHMRYGTASLDVFKTHAGVQYEEGFLVDPSVEQHYMNNMGRSREQYDEEVRGLSDLRFTYQGVRTFASAGHHQFVALRQVLLDILPGDWDGKLMGRMVELEEKIDQLGYLRLSTEEPVTRLLGNVVGSEMAQLANSLSIQVQAVKAENIGGLKQRIILNPIIKKVAWFLYNRLYKIISA